MVPDLGKVARLIGDPVRSKMLFGMLDGKEHAASELAFAGGASAQSASAHLAKLVESGLLSVRSQGRRRLFRLTSPEIARALEVLASIAPVKPVASLNEHNAMQRLKLARTCYDHVAGRLGVAVTENLLERDVIRADGEQYAVTRAGSAFLERLGIDLALVRGRRRHFARACLDWTERRHHIAGALGQALLEAFVQREWVMRNQRDRALAITAGGHEHFKALFSLQLIE